MTPQFEIKTAQRKGVKVTALLHGATNSGKTMSSLLLAYGLVSPITAPADRWSKIGVIDSEGGRAHQFSHLGEFKVIELEPPYTPDRYFAAIKYMEESGIEVIIVDSLTHLWKGIGGLLDMVAKSKQTNDFAKFGDIDEPYAKLVFKILKPTVHMIFTSRAKMTYVLQKNDKGRNEPVRVGMNPEIRQGLEYEFIVGFSVNAMHQASCTKKPPMLFDNFKDVVLTSAHGEWLRKWSENVPAEASEEPEADVVAQILADFESSDIVSLEMKKKNWARRIRQMSPAGLGKVMDGYLRVKNRLSGKHTTPPPAPLLKIGGEQISTSTPLVPESENSVDKVKKNLSKEVEPPPSVRDAEMLPF